jgi:hypothetical protein
MQLATLSKHQRVCLGTDYFKEKYGEDTSVETVAMLNPGIIYTETPRHHGTGKLKLSPLSRFIGKGLTKDMLENFNVTIL